MAEFREALHKMLIGVTKEVGFKDMAAIQAGGDKVTWVTLTPEKLQTDPACSVDALFNGKDENILISIYRRDNEVTVEELEAVAGKALPLLAD